ncbi:MAG: DUF2207 domain-containing protein, partial [bacterium]|nr:DUF2207 domain-containing protein [bacterium]
MKNMTQRLAFVLLFLFAFPFGVSAREVIRDFSVRAELKPDRTFIVTEQIDYDFGTENKHGIYRTVPVKYLRNGVNYNLNLKVLSVFQDGAEASYRVSRSGGAVEVRIGDADVLIRGPHTYLITYQTDRAINFFDDHEELFWNVTGDEWVVPIQHASFTLFPPETALPATMDALCFTGVFGSTDSECERDDGYDLMMQTTGELSPGDGFTIVFSFPKGTILPPTALGTVYSFFSDNWHFTLPFIALFIMAFLWIILGRDPSTGSIIPFYESPDGLSPAEIGMIRDEGAFSRDAMIATIFYLATRGYLHIKAEKDGKAFGSKTTFSFIRKKPADDNLGEDEKVLLDTIFAKGDTAKPSDLRNADFIRATAKMEKNLWQSVQAKNIFVGKPVALRVKCIFLAIVIGWGLGIALQTRPFGSTAGMLTGVIVVLIGWHMPRRTKEGAKLYGKILGFQDFLKVTLKDRLAFHDAPQRSPEQFNELLPFAIVLGVER